MARKKQPQTKLPKAVLGMFVVLVALVTYLGHNSSHETTPTYPINETRSIQSSSQSQAQPPANNQTKSTQGTVASDQQLTDLQYNGRQIIAVNNNQPTFSQSDLSLARGSWQHYSDLDQYNRAGVADAMLGKDLMPTEKRERLYVRPTGYHNKKIRIGNHQDWLYNRCHLIGYQLTGQNNNLKNLVTGTRSLNDPAMTYYENRVANYIKTTGHHVRYQVRPVFVGNELVARGIQMQGRSIEDDQISFNIYIFNIQNGYHINYLDGTSQVATS